MLDEQHTLIATHRPDLLRLPEIMGAMILVGLVIGWFRNKIEQNESRTIYAMSLAVLPFIIFNQQMLTGKTMQVFHFDLFVINYSTLIGLLVAVSLLWRSVPRRLLIWLGALSLAWGVFTVALPARLVFVPSAAARDQRIPVLLLEGNIKP